MPGELVWWVWSCGIVQKLHELKRLPSFADFLEHFRVKIENLGLFLSTPSFFTVLETFGAERL